MTSEKTAYIQGWRACMGGEDGRFTNPYERQSGAAYAWDHGWLDAMDAEDGEKPYPESAGYGDTGMPSEPVASAPNSADILALNMRLLLHKLRTAPHTVDIINLTQAMQSALDEYEHAKKAETRALLQTRSVPDVDAGSAWS